jgi:hypothetical protein
MHEIGITERIPHRRRYWRRQLLSTMLMALMAAGSLLGAASPAVAAPLSAFGEPFHFLAPLGAEAGDPTKFDASLLDELIVSICRVDGSSCTPIKTLTSASSLSERLRIGPTNGAGSYYLANWDVSKVKLTPWTVRVTVTVARLQLGSIDVGPATYKSFGRTWPIKFRIENNPTIRVRVLHEAGKSASQIANAIRLEFGLCGDDVAQLLANDLDPFTQEQIDLAIAGVCQPAVIPATTKVADPATQDALTSFDPTTGRMTFSGSTTTLANLQAGDVLVGEPGANATNGYLRKVSSIAKDKKSGVITVETTQALLNEAVREGTLDAAAELHPDDLVSTEALPGVTLRESTTAAAAFGALDVGDGFDFHESVDVTLEGSASGDGVDGNGTVHIRGRVDFNAGWNIGLGIEGCLSITLACVDRFEAHVGAHLYSDLHVDGTFDGHLQREVTLSTHYFRPIIFFIGPIPVVIIPIVKAIAGVNGDAHMEFSFDAQIQSNLDLGAKWTDPDDGGNGWQPIASIPEPTGDAHGDLLATMRLRAYAKADAKLLLYGIAGPGVAGQLGMDARVQFPGTPLWQIYGYANGEVNFAVDLGGLLTLAEYHHTFLDEDILLRSAENQPPTCSGRTDPIPLAPNVEYYLGPRSSDAADDSFGDGYFACADPEGGDLNPPVGKEGSTVIDLKNAKWASGDHDVVITVTDEAGKTSEPFTLHIKIIDTPPILSVTNSGDSVPASVQYFVTASAWDVEGGAQHKGGYLPCTAMTWQVTGGSATKAASNQTCTVSVVFTQTGYQTVKVTATEPGGKFSEHTVTVLVGAAPSNAAPVIDMDHFDVMAASGPKMGCFPGPTDCHEACVSGFFCMVPMDSIMYNGTVGEYHAPLTLSVDATDPNGDALTVQWFCQVGGYNYRVTDNGDGTFDCSPFSSSITTPILIWATVSDGITTVKTEVRRLFMLDRLV